MAAVNICSNFGAQKVKIYHSFPTRRSSDLASASVLPMNIQDWFPFWLTSLISWLSRDCLLQHRSSKASILQCSAFFNFQLSHTYMTTGKTIALIIQTFVSKVMSLLFNMLSRLVIAFLLRSKRLLLPWLQSPSTMILEPKKIKSDTTECLTLSFPLYI